MHFITYFVTGENTQNDYRKLYIGTVLATIKELDPNGSRPFVASSPSNGIESVQENYTAKNPDDPVFGMCKIDINTKKKNDILI
jgi:hypothetical protein